ncbi:Esterase/lipase/thioesterase [Heterobasidion irregulare TC 32-1]|uniref:Esterase/lipase/thioesterase n=1 Tax=Heterobasidion irregulare (strain TC 32-1) TaxID=747525 RepID=W4KCG0_HETIT|nr:Esterase/lipase/thioesterase [Heterobasidion irregulare TC 32-1]ETW83419.1 Esterase/lipase/thioesterase [Heterobasidion irregulare TC 32-1]
MDAAAQPLFPNPLVLPTGLALETCFAPASLDGADDYDGATAPRSALGSKLAVCLHPWSRLGGNMYDPILETLVHPLTRNGYHVLRYNARGVGDSSGAASFTGFQEAQDLKELVQYAVARLGGVQELLLVGYSHGSLITSFHSPLPLPTRTSHILLSYPFGPRQFLTAFNSGKYQDAIETLLKDAGARVLIVYGDADEFTSASSYTGWIERLRNVASTGMGSEEGTVRERMQIECVAGATHFWTGQSRGELVRVVKAFLDEGSYSR